MAEGAAQLNYGRAGRIMGASRSRASAISAIQRDNAFPPQAIKDQMLELGLPDDRGRHHQSLNNLALGPFHARRSRRHHSRHSHAPSPGDGSPAACSPSTAISAAAGRSAYYQRGEVRLLQDVVNNLIPANFGRGDRCGEKGRRPATPPGIRAEAPSSAVSSLTDPDERPRAARYLRPRRRIQQQAWPTSMRKPGQNYQVQRLTEAMVSSLRTGTIASRSARRTDRQAIAAGVERRMERGRVTTDEGAEARLYSLGNFTLFTAGTR